jgi:acyl dehydratase
VSSVQPVSAFDLAWGATRGLLRGGDGRDLPAIALRVDGVRLDAEAVAAYAALCGFPPGAGVPLTYPHILGFALQMRIMLATGFPFPVMGLVHIHNRIRQRGALRIGEALTISARTGRVFAHDKGQAFSLETWAMRDGVTVWEGESVYLRLGRPGRGGPAPVLDDVAASTPVETWQVPGDLGRRYARVSGDANPIHTSALGARLFGFRGPIAHGMWAKARAVAALTQETPLDDAEVEVAFRAPLFLPGEARLRTGPDGAFDLTDASGDRTHLRGHLTTSPPPNSQDPSVC